MNPETQPTSPQDLAGVVLSMTRAAFVGLRGLFRRKASTRETVCFSPRPTMGVSVHQRNDLVSSSTLPSRHPTAKSPSLTPDEITEQIRSRTCRVRARAQNQLDIGLCFMQAWSQIHSFILTRWLRLKWGFVKNHGFVLLSG